MEIKLGRMRGELVAAANFRDVPLFYAIRRGHAISRSRVVYTWNCNPPFGNPNPPRPSIRLGNIVSFYLLDGRLKFDAAASRTLRDDVLQLAGLRDLSALVDALNTAIPPPSFNIDYAELADPFKGEYSFKIAVIYTYMQMLFRPRGLGLADQFYVDVPVNASMSTIVTGSCGGAIADGQTLTYVSPHFALYPAALRLEREFERDSKEAFERMVDELFEDFISPPLRRPPRPGLVPGTPGTPPDEDGSFDNEAEEIDQFLDDVEFFPDPELEEISDPETPPEDPEAKA